MTKCWLRVSDDGREAGDGWSSGAKTCAPPGRGIDFDSDVDVDVTDHVGNGYGERDGGRNWEFERRETGKPSILSRIRF